MWCIVFGGGGRVFAKSLSLSSWLLHGPKQGFRISSHPEAVMLGESPGHMEGPLIDIQSTVLAELSLGVLQPSHPTQEWRSFQMIPAPNYLVTLSLQVFLAEDPKISQAILTVRCPNSWPTDSVSLISPFTPLYLGVVCYKRRISEQSHHHHSWTSHSEVLIFWSPKLLCRTLRVFKNTIQAQCSLIFCGVKHSRTHQLSRVLESIVKRANSSDWGSPWSLGSSKDVTLRAGGGVQGPGQVPRWGGCFLLHLFP